MLATVPLSSLHVDRSVSLRKSDCLPTVRRYARSLQAGDTFPSMQVCADEQGKYWLADGFLRYDAHALAGTDEVTVRVHPGGVRGARMLACGANDLHGRQRTVAEKRAAVERMLVDPEWRTWSDRLIAETCRVSHTFVAMMRNRLEHGGQGASQPASRAKPAVKPQPHHAPPRATSRETTADPPAASSSTAPPAWVRAIPTAPGLCELPRLPARRDLPPVDPERAAAAVDALAHARDMFLAGRGRLIEAQSLAPDPHCSAVAEGIDHALANLLAWLERIDPHFEEEGRPPRLPQVMEAAAHLPAERANLQRAIAASLPTAQQQPQPPVSSIPTEAVRVPTASAPPAPDSAAAVRRTDSPAILKSALRSLGAQTPMVVRGIPLEAQTKPAWMTDEMYAAATATLAGVAADQRVATLPPRPLSVDGLKIPETSRGVLREKRGKRE